MNHYEIGDYNPLDANFSIPQEFVPIRRYPPEAVLSTHAIEKFERLGISLRKVQLFTTKPLTVTGIHIDGHSVTESKSAINYVISGIGTMKWYSLKNTNTVKMETPAGTGYLPVDPKDCEETDSVNLNKLTLVEICQPHNIINNTEQFRHCFSIRYNNGGTFEEMKLKLAQWNNI